MSGASRSPCRADANSPPTAPARIAAVRIRFSISDLLVAGVGGCVQGGEPREANPVKNEESQQGRDNGGSSQAEAFGAQCFGMNGCGFGAVGVTHGGLSWIRLSRHRERRADLNSGPALTRSCPPGWV